jgi:hypothetical protein
MQMRICSDGRVAHMHIVLPAMRREDSLFTLRQPRREMIAIFPRTPTGDTCNGLDCRCGARTRQHISNKRHVIIDQTISAIDQEQLTSQASESGDASSLPAVLKRHLPGTNSGSALFKGKSFTSAPLSSWARV